NIVAGGDFSEVNDGSSRDFLASFDINTGLATAWQPEPDNLVRALASDGTNLYAGGYFRSLNGSVERHGIAAFDAGGNVTSFDPNINVSSIFGVLALALDRSNLFAVGDFRGAGSVNGGLTRNFAAAFDLKTANATQFDPDLDAPVRAVAVNGNT